MKSEEKDRLIINKAAKFVILHYSIIRKAKKITQAKVAEIAQISKPCLSQKEAMIHSATIDDYLALCYATQIDPVKHLASSLELSGIKKDFWVGGNNDDASQNV